MKNILISSFITLAGLIGLPQKAMAICTVENPTVSVAPLQAGSITVGRDVPVGTVVYQQFVQTNSPTSAECLNLVSPFLIGRKVGLTSTPMPLAPFNTGRFGGKVYQTDVAGLGVAFEQMIDIVPTERFITNCPNTSSCRLPLTAFANFQIYIIKIANIVENGVISGSRMPSIQFEATPGGANSVYVRASMSGNINVVSRTCRTPNVEVDMGTHKVSELTQANSATPWKDFSIELNDCPAFFGNRAAGWPSNPPNNTSGVQGNYLGTFKSNTIQVNLIGTVPPTNPSQGILALNPAGGTLAWPATGIGLQVANSAGTPVAIGPGAWIPGGITTQAIEGMSYTVPLKARYLRTTGPVGPGQANATAQFTINYQ